MGEVAQVDVEIGAVGQHVGEGARVGLRPPLGHARAEVGVGLHREGECGSRGALGPEPAAGPLGEEVAAGRPAQDPVGIAGIRAQPRDLYACRPALRHGAGRSAAGQGVRCGSWPFPPGYDDLGIVVRHERERYRSVRGPSKRWCQAVSPGAAAAGLRRRRNEQHGEGQARGQGSVPAPPPDYLPPIHALGEAHPSHLHSPKIAQVRRVDYTAGRLLICGLTGRSVDRGPCGCLSAVSQRGRRSG